MTAEWTEPRAARPRAGAKGYDTSGSNRAATLASIGMLSSLLQEPPQVAKKAPQVAYAATWSWGQQSEPVGWLESTVPRAHGWFFPEPEAQSVAIEIFL